MGLALLRLHITRDHALRDIDMQRFEVPARLDLQIKATRHLLKAASSLIDIC